MLAANTSGALVKTGSNQLTISTASTYSGGARIATGTLRYSNVSALGTGTVAFTGNSTLNANSAGTLALATWAARCRGRAC